MRVLIHRSVLPQPKLNDPVSIDKEIRSYVRSEVNAFEVFIQPIKFFYSYHEMNELLNLKEIFFT